MKKLLVIAFAIILSGIAVAWAGHFTDILPPASASGCTPVSNGYDYNCSTDNNAPQAVFNTVKASSMTMTGSIGLLSQTITQLNALTPTTTGQIVFCNNCAVAAVCVSSGVGQGAWVVVSSTGGIVTGQSHCQ